MVAAAGRKAAQAEAAAAAANVQGGSPRQDAGGVDLQRQLLVHLHLRMPICALCCF